MVKQHGAVDPTAVVKVKSPAAGGILMGAGVCGTRCPFINIFSRRSRGRRHQNLAIPDDHLEKSKFYILRRRNIYLLDGRAQSLVGVARFLSCFPLLLLCESSLPRMHMADSGKLHMPCIYFAVEE